MRILDLIRQEYVITDKFIQLLEDHKEELKMSISTTRVVQNFSYAGDLYGLLTSMNIDRKYHYAILLVNDIKTSYDFKGDTPFLYIPNLDIVDRLARNINR